METEKVKFIQEFTAYMSKHNTRATAWYVGITEDPKNRLFTAHSVDEAGPWIYNAASTEDVARSVEEHFVSQLGTMGDTGGGKGNGNCRYVYAYLIKPTTVQ